MTSLKPELVQPSGILDSPKVTTSGWVGGSRSTVAFMHVEVASTSKVVNKGMEGKGTSWGHD